jgi:hypothetical protein
LLHRVWQPPWLISHRSSWIFLGWSWSALSLWLLCSLAGRRCSKQDEVVFFSVRTVISE